MRISRCARCVHRMLTQVRSLRGGVKLALGVRAQRCMPILSRRDVAFEMIQFPQSLLYLHFRFVLTGHAVFVAR